MTLSTIIAVIGGIVTAACAIAGAIAGIKARRAEERRQEELRRAEHQARINQITENNRMKIRELISRRSQNTEPVYQQPVNNTVQQNYNNTPVNTYTAPVSNYAYGNNTYPINQYTGYGGYGGCGRYGGANYAYGPTTYDDVYRGEREIGNISKMEMYQHLMRRQNYYPQQNPYQYAAYPYYAYAS